MDSHDLLQYAAETLERLAVSYLVTVAGRATGKLENHVSGCYNGENSHRKARKVVTHS